MLGPAKRDQDTVDLAEKVFTQGLNPDKTAAAHEKHKANMAVNKGGVTIPILKSRLKEVYTANTEEDRVELPEGFQYSQPAKR